MTYSLDQHRRRSIRLSGYDYSQNGAYFVTVCTKNREGLFGEMRLNDAGNIACQCWKDIPLHFPHVGPDGFVIMPNHIHGILFINDIVGAKNFSPLRHPDHSGWLTGAMATDRKPCWNPSRRLYLRSRRKTRWLHAAP